MKQHNPKSYKLRRRDSSNSWSELPQDLLNSVFERLGFDDSRRAKSVCSSWYSAARRCVAKKQTPWLILFPDEDNHWCALFNPEEKGGKLYKMRDHDQRVEFAKSFCLATYGNWLFMVDHWYNLYIFNIFTQERIDLPPVESQLGTIKLERCTFKRKEWFCISNDHGLMEKSQDIRMESPVFWIDEQTKEYVVIWGFSKWCVVYSKKGDEFWNQIQVPIVPGCSEMVYKDHMLYFLLNDYVAVTKSCIKIFDISGETPQQTFHCGLPANNSSLLLPTRNSWRILATKLVVTVTGDVLKVEKWGKSVTPTTRLWSFRIYKVYSSGFFNKFEQVDSLGDEAMLFDLGITVLANDDIVGFKRNSIYYNTICHERYTTQMCLFNLETQEMEPVHKFDCSSPQQLARARWFLPSFKQT